MKLDPQDIFLLGHEDTWGGGGVLLIKNLWQGQPATPTFYWACQKTPTSHPQRNLLTFSLDIFQIGHT